MTTRLPGSKYKGVFDRGRPLRGHLVNAWVLESAGAGRQAGVVISKKSFHDAVDRNRAKRIMREGFRMAAPKLPESCSWVMVGRAALAGKHTADVAAELVKMAARLGR